MMNMLPFLKGKKWPRMGKPTGETKYGFSEHDELSEQLLGELMAAYTAKEPSLFIEALRALIHLIQSKEGFDAQHNESPA